jgi:hypothetical protein
MLRGVTALLSKEVSILTKATDRKNTATDELIYSTLARGNFYMVILKIIRIMKTRDRERIQRLCEGTKSLKP